jgi:hypothetical protein
MSKSHIYTWKIEELSITQLKTVVFNYCLKKIHLSWIQKLYYQNLIYQFLILLHIPVKITIIIALIL